MKTCMSSQIQCDSQLSFAYSTACRRHTCHQQVDAIDECHGHNCREQLQVPGFPLIFFWEEVQKKTRILSLNPAWLLSLVFREFYLHMFPQFPPIFCDWNFLLVSIASEATFRQSHEPTSLASMKTKTQLSIVTGRRQNIRKTCMTSSSRCNCQWSVSWDEDVQCLQEMTMLMRLSVVVCMQQGMKTTCMSSTNPMRLTFMCHGHNWRRKWLSKLEGCGRCFNFLIFLWWRNFSKQN